MEGEVKPEEKLKAEIKAYLKQIGAWFFMPVPMGYGRDGIPDFICCWHGKFYAIETKAPHRRGEKDGGCTVWQKRELDGIAAAEGIALVAYSPDDVKNVLF